MAVGLFHSNFWEDQGAGPTTELFLTAMSRIIGPITVALVLIAVEAMIR
jgi:hypothetical protein